VRICGLAAVEALFAHDPERVERLFFEPRWRARLAPASALLARTRRPYREVEADELSRVAGTPLHGGVVAVARPRPVPMLDLALIPGWAAEGRLLLVLDGVGNPHNLGAIARSAAFFGVPRMLLAERPEQALPSDASYRVAEGGLEELALYRARLAEALPALKPHFRLVGTSPEGAVPPSRVSSRGPLALILGNEEKGLSRATLALCDEIVRIEGKGRVQSLNVAAAAAILLYALTRG
jgi:TrmH RNA methyltransferase